MFNQLGNKTMKQYKRKQTTCRCEAYPFPHRLDSGKCRELYNEKVKEEMRAEDSLKSLGLVGLFAPDNSQPIRFQ